MADSAAVVRAGQAAGATIGPRTPTSPPRKQERAMNKFMSPGGAQRFLSAFSGITALLIPTPPAHAVQYRHEMDTRFTTWNEVVGFLAAA